MHNTMVRYAQIIVVIKVNIAFVCASLQQFSLLVPNIRMLEKNADTYEWGSVSEA